MNRVGAQAPPHLDDVAIAPLSFAQERLWMIDRLVPGAGTYNVRRAIRIRGVLDVAALRHSLADIVDRHEILRTTLAVVDGEPVQVIGPVPEFGLPLVDLGGLPDAEAEAATQRFIREEGNRGFDLAVGPLIRAALVRLRPTDHVLFVVMHHIVTDDWSMGLFDRELSALYEAHRGGRRAALPELAVQYADFAVWQRDWLRGEVMERHLRYWREALAGAPPRIDLPRDRARPAAPRSAGASESIRLDAAVADGLRSLARAHDATLFMVLLATFNVLVYRYSGQPDIVVGAPIANRTRPELEALIGFFVNTLPLRARLNGSLTFDELLRQIRSTTLAAYDHAELPFEKLVAELAPERTAGETPLVNVLFQVQHQREDRLALAGLQLSAFPLENALAKFDLVFRVGERSDGLDCTIVYSTDVFDASRIRTMLAHFENLVRASIAAPGAPIASLAMLTDREREQQVVEWNATTTPYADDSSLSALFEAQVERTPDAIALGCNGSEYSYARLNALADALAWDLRARGLAHEERVAICTERSSAMVVATLAVLKAGGAYLPIDPDYPPPRVRHMLGDAGVRIVLTQRSTLARLPEDLAEIVLLDVDADRPLPSADLGPPRAASGDDLAYVIYTSGSTGTPKGVLVTQRAVCRLVTNASYVTVDERDVVAQVSSFSFDALTFELWAALLHGARLEIAARETVLSPDLFARWLVARRVSVMFLTAALFRLMSRERPAAFSGLRYLLVGGETMDPPSTAAVLAAGAPGCLVNAYGPTETTTFATTYDVHEVRAEGIPIGRPISNTQAYVLDGDLNPVPVGMPGQLYLGGPGLARGYLNDDALTAAKFIVHPFAAAGERLYATGDVVRFLPDGNIDFIGRRDHQVKIRGFRVETGEIEAVLRRQPAVRDALVRTYKNDDGEPQLLAYVVDDAQPVRAPEHWRRTLAAELPAYMLPAAVFCLAELPLNGNGKIDIAALPEPRGARSDEPAVRMNNPLHYQLVVIWEELLGASQIGIRDNFFEIGGHSLLAARLMAAVESQTGKALSLARFLEEPTIAHLAKLLLESANRGPASPVTALQAGGSRAPLFFLHSDLNGGGYYTRTFARRLDPDQPFYVIAPHGTDGGPCPPTIEAMANEYVAAIRAVRPEGPYLLGGFCSGGLVALEMARRLRSTGSEVRNVILLDVPGANARLGRVASTLDAFARALRLTDTLRLAACGVLGQAAASLRRTTARLRRTVQLARSGGLGALSRRLVVGPIRRDYLEPEYPWLEPFWRRVTIRHIPRPYGGLLTLLVSEQHGPIADSVIVRRWGTISQRLLVHPIPGEHLTCITRFADETAVRLAQVLEVEARTEVSEDAS